VKKSDFYYADIKSCSIFAAQMVLWAVVQPLEEKGNRWESCADRLL